VSFDNTTSFAPEWGANDVVLFASVINEAGAASDKLVSLRRDDIVGSTLYRNFCVASAVDRAAGEDGQLEAAQAAALEELGRLPSDEALSAIMSHTALWRPSSRATSGPAGDGDTGVHGGAAGRLDSSGDGGRDALLRYFDIEGDRRYRDCRVPVRSPSLKESQRRARWIVVHAVSRVLVTMFNGELAGREPRGTMKAAAKVCVTHLNRNVFARKGQRLFSTCREVTRHYAPITYSTNHVERSHQRNRVSLTYSARLRSIDTAAKEIMRAYEAQQRRYHSVGVAGSAPQRLKIFRKWRRRVQDGEVEHTIQVVESGSDYYTTYAVSVGGEAGKCIPYASGIAESDSTSLRNLTLGPCEATTVPVSVAVPRVDSSPSEIHWSSICCDCGAGMPCVHQAIVHLHLVGEVEVPGASTSDCNDSPGSPSSSDVLAEHEAIDIVVPSATLTENEIHDESEEGADLSQALALVKSLVHDHGVLPRHIIDRLSSHGPNFNGQLEPTSGVSSERRNAARGDTDRRPRPWGAALRGQPLKKRLRNDTRRSTNTSDRHSALHMSNRFR